MLDTLRLCMHAAISDQFWKRMKEVNMWCFTLLLTIIIAKHHMFMGSRQTLLSSRFQSHYLWNIRFLTDFKVIIFEILERSQQFSRGILDHSKPWLIVMQIHDSNLNSDIQTWEVALKAFWELRDGAPSSISSFSHSSFLSVCVCLIAKLCPTFCVPMNFSPPASSVHRILQARILERVAIPFSRGFSWTRDWSWISCIAGGFFTMSHQECLASVDQKDGHFPEDTLWSCYFCVTPGAQACGTEGRVSPDPEGAFAWKCWEKESVTLET